MKIIQSLNQNAVLVLDNNGKEMVALGKGIGFNKKKGDIVHETAISRFFTIQSSEQEQHILENLKSIDSEVYILAEDVVHFAEQELQKKLHESFIFTIAKHIQFAIDRSGEEIEYDPFQYQLNYLYPAEYRVAKELVSFLNQKYHLRLKRQEESFFTLHLVNGLIDSEQFNDIVQLSHLLNQVLMLIDEEVSVKLEKESLAYSRFVIHLRYFLIRALSKFKSVSEEDIRINELLDLTKEMYPDEYKILYSIKVFFGQEHQLYFGIDEDLYLLLHLVRICRKEEEK